MNYKIVIGVFLVTLLCIGCKDDVDSAGAASLGKDENVMVCATTFSGMASHTDSIKDFYCTQTPDSFLIGECNTDSWATIKADLLAQFACPSGSQFPRDAAPGYPTRIDSIALVMTYSSWFGDGNSPLRLSVYEMDGETFQYDHVYTSQEALSRYWSGNDSTHAVLSDRTIVAATPSDSVYVSESSTYLPFIRFRMNDRFVEKMNSLPDMQFPSQEQFNDFFKGLYITTTWGASTALYVSNVSMIIYYHYFYEQTEGSGVYLKQDDAKYLYANSEVRQVNRFSFPYKNFIINQLQQQEDSVNYIISPTYVYTVLRLPLGQYVRTVNDSVNRDGKSLRPYINKARMRVDVVDVDNNGNTAGRWAKPANDMLLIRKDSLQNFFLLNKLPSSDYCLFSTLSQSVDSLYNVYYYYDFDLSTILQSELRKSAISDSTIDMVMVPVQVEYSSSTSSSTISRVKLNQTITFTAIKSAQLVTDPLDVDLVFSGFSVKDMH